MQTGTWIDLGAPVFSAPDGREYHAVFQSAGNFTQIVPASGVAATTSFTQQDQVTACFMPVPLPGLPPGPCITVDAAISTSGSVRFDSMPVITPSGSGLFIGRNDGIIQQIDSLTETIIMPDGSTQTLTQNSQDSGIFIIAILVG
jgi:hypothetical protein